MKRELRLIFTALVFFTRIPCTCWAGHSEDDLNNASRYFPLIGILVGTTAAVAWWMLFQIFPQEIAVIGSMVATLWLTGAFHEDGLADTADGMGGGLTKEQVLTIMQDSRIGSFGTVALFLALLTKFETLVHINAMLLPAVLVSGHAVSRFGAVLVIGTQSYVRETGKAKPLAQQISFTGLLIAAIFGLVPLVMLQTNLWWALLPVVVTWLWFSLKLKQRLGGYTGDCLGAMQQLCELAFYLGMLACTLR